MAVVTRATSAKNGSGTFGGEDIGCLTNITFTETQELDVYACSDTNGQRSRIPGHQDSSGQFTMLVDPSTAGITRGAEDILTLNDTTGNTVFNGNVVIGDIERGIPIEDGTRLTWSITWGQRPDTGSSS